MTRTKEDDSKAELRTEAYFVPGVGELEATNLKDLEEQVKELKEKQEDGDGDI